MCGEVNLPLARQVCSLLSFLVRSRLLRSREMKTKVEQCEDIGMNWDTSVEVTLLSSLRLLLTGLT